LFRRRLAIVGCVLAVAAAFPGRALAVDLVGVNDMVRNSSTTVHATRVTFDTTTTFDPTNNTWLMRLLVKNGGNRMQVGVGNSAGNQYSACPGNFQVTTGAAFVENTFEGVQWCHLYDLGVTGASVRLNRISSDNSWNAYFAGSYLVNKFAMDQPDDIYAGGYIYTSSSHKLVSTFGACCGYFQWDRTANFDNTGWTTIQSSQKIQEDAWIVDNPPSPFQVEYN
jgi:hypothetical protein